MRLLRLQAYCFPEQTAGTHLIGDMYEGYAKNGITAEVYVPTPTRGIDKETRNKYKKIKYEELYDGHLVIHRFALFREGRNPLQRALRYALCNLIQYWKAVRAKDIDVVFCASTPPTQGMLCAKIAKKLSKKYKRHVPFVYNLQDIFPDSLVTANMTKKGSFLWKIGRKIENYTYRHADKIIVISEDFKRNIMEKGVPEEKIVIIPNWVDTEAVRPVFKEDNRLPEEFGIDRDKFTVVYAGNLGEAQGAGIILEAARELTDVQFVIFGGGSELENVKRTAEALPNVIVNALLPQDRVAEVYSLGDVALITGKKGVGGSALPSKTWSIMACNTPIIAAFDPDSELAKIIDEAHAGVCIPPEDVQELVRAIRRFSEAADVYGGGREYVCRYASKETCVGQYVAVLKNSLS